MKIEIYYSKASRKFLKNNKASISQSDVENKLSDAVKKIAKIENNQTDVKKLKGKFRDCFRIRTGKIRIVFKIEYGIVYLLNVFSIDFRGEVYKKK